MMAAKPAKKTWSLLTDAERQMIIDLNNTGKYRQKDIALKVRRGEATVCNVLKKYKSDLGKGDEEANMVEAKVTATSHPGKKHPTYPLTESQLSLDKDEIKLLKKSAESDGFIKDYFRQIGFDRRTTDQLRDFWARRDDILEHDRKKHEIKPPVTKITMKADGEVGSVPSLETLVTHTNQFLAECIQLHKEMLDVTKKQLMFFEQERDRMLSEKARLRSQTDFADR
jgi:hypothetical protein